MPFRMYGEEVVHRLTKLYFEVSSHNLIGLKAQIQVCLWLSIKCVRNNIDGLCFCHVPW